MPVGNRPIINTVIDWVLQSGIRGERCWQRSSDGTDILVIADKKLSPAIYHSIRETFSPSTHPRARITIKNSDDGEKDDLDGEDNGAAPTPECGGFGDRTGTARILKRFRGMIKVGTGQARAESSPTLSSCPVISSHRNQCLWHLCWTSIGRHLMLSLPLYSMSR
jgi:hypothetical protein